MAKSLYKVKCFWTLGGTLDIEAENEDEARELAMEAMLPEKGEYLEASFEIDTVEEAGPA